MFQAETSDYLNVTDLEWMRFAIRYLQAHKTIYNPLDWTGSPRPRTDAAPWNSEIRTTKTDKYSQAGHSTMLGTIAPLL